MGMRDLINKFTSGELDPRFLAEVDYEGYRKAARKLRNVVSTPQGGAQRRFGSIYQDTMEDGTTPITNIEKVRLIGYEHSNDQVYDIIIRQDSTSVVAFDIYLNVAGVAVFQLTVPAAPNTYTQAMVRQIRWVKDYDRLILLHEAVPPYELRRISTSVWSLDQIQFQFFPTFDFSSIDPPATLPTPFVPYTDPSVTFTPNAMDATTVTASTAVYTSNHVGGLYLGNAGVFRITAVNPAGTVATGFSTQDFVDTSAIRGDLSALFERAWNDGKVIAGAPAGIPRGWPAHGAFYQSRLLMGGSPSLSGTVYASNVREYYNFDDSSSDPSFTYSLEIGITGNDVLTDIISTKSIVLISNKGSATSNLLLNEPTTPTNNFINTQGTEGSREMNAINVDNQIIYADTSGNTMWSMSYDIPDTGYSIINASILSAHLIRNPRWADVFDPDNLDGRYYLLCNSDGTMAVYNTIKEENIKAWTLESTNGSYVDVACTANQAKTLVRRKVVVASPTGYPDAFYTVDNTFNAFRDMTPQIVINGNVAIFQANQDYILIGNEIPFTKLGIIFDQEAGTGMNLHYEFLTDVGNWELFTPKTDTTLGMTADGQITWDEVQVSNWGAAVLDNTTPVYGELKPYYWLRISRNNPATVELPVISNFIIDTDSRIYLESLNFDLYMDCQINETSDKDGNIYGLESLAGQNVFIYADGFPIGSFYVPITGTVKISTLDASVNVGIDYLPIIVPMPVVALLQNGWSVYEPVHVKTMYIDYYYSLGITVQGQSLPQISPGDFMTQLTPVPQTDYYKLPIYNGWDSRAEFTISQSYPAPFTLRGISYTMEVSP